MSVTEFIWNNWDDYFNNIDLTMESGVYSISCRKGLWSVSANSLKVAMKESLHYFQQYWRDGEYSENPDEFKKRIIEQLRNNRSEYE